MIFLGLDPDRVDALATAMRNQATAADTSVKRIQTALVLAELTSPVPGRLGARSDDWRIAAAHLTTAAGLARDHVLDAEWYDLPGQAANQLTLHAILRNGLPEDATEQTALAHGCDAPQPEPGGSNIGDVGGTFSVEERTEFSICDSSPQERGRDALIRMIADTGTPMQIGNDEFEIIRHNDNTYTIVLAGVTDLSNPDRGLNEQNYTVRDVDVYALASATNTTVEDNFYARLVSDYAMTHLPLGSNIMIVGHSFGADTAADLAADPVFNGPHGFNVTHIVVAAYHSGPQLEHIPDTTQVLVLQNELDVAVAAERLLHDPNIALHEGMDAAAAAMNGDTSFFGHAWNSVTALDDAWMGAQTQALDAVLDAPDIVSSAWNGDASQVLAHTTDLLPELGVTAPNDQQTVAVFPGGLSGVGHEQEHYIEFLDAADDSLIIDFFVSVDAAGYTNNGSSLAVDASVPQ